MTTKHETQGVLTADALSYFAWARDALRHNWMSKNDVIELLDTGLRKAHVEGVAPMPEALMPKTPPAPVKTANLTGTRPSKGATKRVWEIADEVTGDGPVDRTAIIEACVAQGINKSTAGTQYSKWKKARS